LEKDSHFAYPTRGRDIQMLRAIYREGQLAVRGRMRMAISSLSNRLLTSRSVRSVTDITTVVSSALKHLFCGNFQAKSLSSFGCRTVVQKVLGARTRFGSVSFTISFLLTINFHLIE
jgi:hypothetical protein